MDSSIAITKSIQEKEFIAPGFGQQIKALSSIDQLQAIKTILIQWLVIVIAVAGALAFKIWWIYLIAAFVITTRKHALGIILHDAVHFRLFSNRQINDLVSNLFLAFPVGLSTEKFRRFHIEHHRHLGTEQDPEVRLNTKFSDSFMSMPKSYTEFCMLLLKDLLGLHALSFLQYCKEWSAWFDLPGIQSETLIRERKLLWFYMTFLFIFLWVTNGWINFLFLWFLPSFTFLPMIFRIRHLAEHSGLAHSELVKGGELLSSRSMMPPLIEKLIFAPCNINYHLEHHLFPSVPFYNLPRLHKLLMSSPAYAENITVGQSYLTIIPAKT